MLILPLKVVHCKKDKFDTYIGRGSKWGNPFLIGEKYTREEAIAKYEKWILTQPHLLDSLWELEGRILGCWCSPKACHGDVLIKIINDRNING